MIGEGLGMTFSHQVYPNNINLEQYCVVFYEILEKNEEREREFPFPHRNLVGKI